ncbi:tetratricopeptide repeat protein [Paraburkholderia silvatlantica]|uniref:Flp pilus assembly protein TadD n=1 Tax=Paraburkholderia silvatlantica TaxID=321895 RepID=A0A2V4TBJ5_9BURK|nr:tetratricopeptide repeat-containing glycosyltransferase family protein [Paraburkholderia silvatlantica]PYE22845.1 Flp pilus assembly protein TadD [Paraburkholderia silvatlantica]TDQ89866.1 Flp pilus assembly protein TadD [Paraburkholderia silvatlantica]
MTPVDEWFQLGLEQHRAGGLEQAESMYQQVLQHDPQHAEALHLLGVVASQRSQFDHAQVLIGRAVALRPDVASYHASLANAFSGAGALDAATLHYDQALQLQPDFAEAHNSLGKVKLAQGQIAAAVACFRGATASRPEYWQAHHALGTALMQLGEFDAAITAYQAAITLNPAAPNLYSELNAVLAAAGREFDAVDVYLGAIAAETASADETRKQAAGRQPLSAGAEAAERGEAGTWFSTVEAFAAELDRRKLDGDVEGALGLVQRIVRTCVFDRRGTAKVFADATLDRCCSQLGKARLTALQAAGDVVEEARVDCVVLATEVYRLGGHTAVIEDLLKTQCFGPRVVLMLTDAFNMADLSVIADRFGMAVESEVAPKGSLVPKLDWALNRLRALRPRRLVLMNHHNDAVTIAAAQPSLADETIFYHHGDHQLCLGVTLEHTVHVDPHPMGFHNCRDVVGVRNAVYWPFIAEDAGGRTAATWMRDGTLRTSSTGSSNKFESPYKIQYADVIPQVLACTGGVHVHIGPLSESTLSRIRGALIALAIPPQRFVHIPWVRSVWKALQALQIDVLIASFPQGGGKALIEAMGSGTPVIGHDCYISPFLGGADLYYPGAFQWARTEELLEHLRGLTPAQLQRESDDARRQYEQFHTVEALSLAINGAPDAPVVPSLRPHRVDPLQTFLDDVRYAQQDYAMHMQLIR